jgi:hypothetical protein
MTLSYSSCAQTKRTFQVRRDLFRLVVGLAALALLFGPAKPTLGAQVSDTNRQEIGATITTPMMWNTQPVDPQRIFMDMGDHSLRLDSTGKAHVAYGGDHLYYASYDGTSWSGETVDTGNNVGQYVSLYIDSEDHPHISYYDGYYRFLKYARNLGGGWEIYVIDRGWTGVKEIAPEGGICQPGDLWYRDHQYLRHRVIHFACAGCERQPVYLLLRSGEWGFEMRSQGARRLVRGYRRLGGQYRAVYLDCCG